MNRPDSGVDVIEPANNDLEHEEVPGVYIMNKHENRASSFFAQPGVLAG